MTKLRDLFSKQVLCSSDAFITVILSVLVGLLICGVLGDQSLFSLIGVACLSTINGLHVSVLRFLDGRADQIQQLRDEKTEMRTRIRRLQESATSGQEEKAQLQRQIVAMEREVRAQSSHLNVQNMNEQLERADRAAALWRNQSRESTSRAAAVERQLANTQERCSQLARERDRIQKEKQALEEKIAGSLQKQENRRLDEINEMRMLIVELNENQETLTERCHVQAKEIKSVVKKLQEGLNLNDSGIHVSGNLSTSFNNSLLDGDNLLNESADNIVAALNDECHKVDMLDQQVKESEYKILNLRQDLKVCQEEIERQRAQLEKQRADNDVYKQYILAQRKKLDETKRMTDQIVQEKERIDGEKQKCLLALQQAFSECKEMQSRNAEIEMLKRDVERQASEIEDLQESNEELQQQCDALQESLSERDETMQSEIDKLKEEQADLTQKYTELEDLKKELEEEMNILQDTNQDLETKLTETFDSLDDMKEKLQKLENLQTFKLYVNKVDGTAE